MSLQVLPIHKHPEYLADCCKIINQEWKRSETARLHSLQQSSDNLPTSLILLKDKTVIGHAKLSVIPSIRKACFIESVVIEKDLRGKGYGSILMKEAENYCRRIGLDTVYLSTKGQEDFYSKLGYTKCAPITIYGSFVPTNIDTQPHVHAEDVQVLENCEEEIGKNRPPPPPLPPIPRYVTVMPTEKTYMKKML